MDAKRVRDSRADQVQVLTQSAMNGYNRLFGGQLLMWIDVVAAVVARRHAHRNVTTAMVDRLTFEGAAHSNDTLVLRGRMVFTGRTSMEVRVDTYVESLEGERTLINTAYIVLVALDEFERPAPVPPLLLETDEEREEFARAKARYEARKAQRV